MSGGPCFTEKLSPSVIAISSISDIPYAAKSKYQNIQIINTVHWGKALVLDGHMQSTERDEYVFHESLVHPIMISHPNPKTVFVGGGGEGATVREILRHGSVKKVVMVDIDEECVEACKKHMPQLHKGSFDDPRTEVVIADGREFIKNTDSTFDIMIFDLADPISGGPAQLLYTEEFYNACKKRLNPGGLFITQSGPAGILEHDLVFSAIYKTLQRVFPSVHAYSAYVPSFYDEWGFVIASPDKDFDPTKLSESEVDSRLHKLLGKGADDLKFLNGESYKGLFALPKSVRKTLNSETRVITAHSTVSV